MTTTSNYYFSNMTRSDNDTCSLDQRNIQNMREAEKRTKTVAAEKDNKSSSKENYVNQKKIKSLNNRLSKTEASITKLEKEIKDIDFELSINYEETILKPNFFDTYQQKKKELEKLMENWGLVTEEIDSIN